MLVLFKSVALLIVAAIFAVIGLSLIGFSQTGAGSGITEETLLGGFRILSNMNIVQILKLENMGLMLKVGVVFAVYMAPITAFLAVGKLLYKLIF